MGAMPTDYPGYQKVFLNGEPNEPVIQKFEKAWGCQLPRTPGLHATDTFTAMLDGRVHGLYIYGEDPVVTDPDTSHVLKALGKLDFFVVQELFMTETAQLARCGPAGPQLCGKGRHLHQHRAAGPAGAQGRYSAGQHAPGHRHSGRSDAAHGVSAADAHSLADFR